MKVYVGEEREERRRGVFFWRGEEGVIWGREEGGVVFQGGVVGGRGGRAVFASFCPSPATIFFLSSVSWASSWNFGGV